MADLHERHGGAVHHRPRITKSDQRRLGLATGRRPPRTARRPRHQALISLR